MEHHEQKALLAVVEGEIPPKNFILDMPYWLKILQRSPEKMIKP